MFVVMAVGGNALLRVVDPKRSNPPWRWHDVELAARVIASVAREHTVGVTHGSGLAVKTGSAATTGYRLELALENEMPRTRVASLVIEVIAHLVPVGLVMRTRSTAAVLQLSSDGWWRRRAPRSASVSPRLGLSESPS